EGYQAQRIDDAGGVSYDLAAITIEGSPGTSYTLEAALLPQLAMAIEQTTLVQLYVPIVGEAAPSAQGEILWTIARINTKLPLVGLGYLDELRLVFFRHCALLPDRSREGALALAMEAIQLAEFVVAHFDAMLGAVARG